MEALMLALITWLATATGLPATTPPPVEFMPACEIERFARQKPDMPCGASRAMYVVAAYDPYRERIILPDTWRADRLFDVSALLHELVHHMQARNGLVFSPDLPCPAETIEKPAYQAQIAFLRAAGVDPLPVMGINDLSLLFLTTCPERLYPAPVPAGEAR